MVSIIPKEYCFEGGKLLLTSSAEQVSNYLIRPIRAYAKTDQALPFACDLELWRGAERHILAKYVKLSALTDMWWKTPPPGCSFAPGARRPHQHLQMAFQHCLRSLKPIVVTCPNKLGWAMLPDGRHVYVSGSGIIDRDGLHEDETVWIPESVRPWKIEVKGVGVYDVIEHFWRIYHALPNYSNILIVYSLLSLLVPLYQEAHVDSRFPLILEGQTESKKTTLACLTSTVYNRNSSPRSCVETLMSTLYAIERRGAELRHGVLVVDDLFPDGGASQRAKALRLIRDVANGLPREAREGSSIAGERLECGIILTAESFPSCELSTRTRCLRLVLKRRIKNSEIALLQQDAELLGDIFLAFIQRVSKSYPDLVKKISQDFGTYRQSRTMAQAPSVPSERLAEIGFVLYEALDVFLELFPHSDRTSILDSFQKSINSWIGWQLSSEAAPNTLDISAVIRAVYASYPKRFKEHQGCWCITPENLCMLIQERCCVTTTASEIIKMLRNRNALLIGRDNASTKKINGGMRYLHIIPDCL